MAGVASFPFSWWQFAFRDIPAPPALAYRHVYLRPPRWRDYAAWAALREQSRDFLVPWEPSWSRDALTRASFRRRLRRMAREWYDGTGFAFFVLRRGDDALLGGVTLGGVRHGVAQTATLGYWIGASHARQGLMTEAVQCALDFAFDRLGLHRVEAACLPANAASRKLLLRCGFHEEGIAREYLRINGVWADHLLFGILSGDGRART